MKILIVDDNLINIRVMRGFLVKWQHEIIESYNGIDAIKKFKAEQPDLILMDIVMPEMDGKQAAKEIKKLVGIKYVPIIFVTALKSELNIIDALEAGGDDYISKPFDKDLLFSKINAHQRIINLNAELSKKNKELNSFNQLIVREQELVSRFFEWGKQMCDIDPEYINFYSSPVSAYNGDIFLIKRRPSGGLYVLIGDFTGHGLTAAIGTLPVTEIFFRLAEKNVSIVDIAREINSKLFKILPVEIFFCASLFEIDRNAQSLSVWSGGLPESYLIDREKNTITTIETQHMPLGILDDSEFKSNIKTYTANQSMQLYCSTDGIIESFNKEGEMYGFKRLKNILINEKKNTINTLLKDVNTFTGGIKQNDDTTIIEVTLQELDDVDILPKSSEAKINNVLPFTLNIKFKVAELRKQNSIIQVTDMLGGNTELRPHKTYLHTIITELYVNALEHGILGLESNNKLDPGAFDRYYKDKTKALENLTAAEVDVKVRMPNTCDKVFITVTHSGNGDKIKTNKHQVTNDQLYGRGLDIVKSLCHAFDYQDNGKLVSVTYLLY